jgi:hypothetical protein
MVIVAWAELVRAEVLVTVSVTVNVPALWYVCEVDVGQPGQAPLNLDIHGPGQRRLKRVKREAVHRVNHLLWPDPASSHSAQAPALALCVWTTSTCRSRRTAMIRARHPMGLDVKLPSVGCAGSTQWLRHKGCAS